MSLTITGANGPPITGVSGCTLLWPLTEQSAIQVSAAHPPTFSTAAGTRTMTIDFHGDCCQPPTGCRDCGCHVCAECHLTLLDQSSSNYIPPVVAYRNQNVPARPISPPGMPDRTRLLFSLAVTAPVNFGKEYQLYVAYYGGTYGNNTGGGFARTLPFWVPGS